jgi:hypothetical protein
MCDAYIESGKSHTLRDARGPTVQMDMGLPTHVRENFDVAPSDVPHANAKHFGGSLLGGESARQPLDLATTVSELALGIDAIQEPIPPTLLRLRDPFDLDYVYARGQSYSHVAPLPSRRFRLSASLPT